MKKYFSVVFIAVFFLFANNCFSGNIPVSLAKKVAYNYYNHYSPYKTIGNIDETITMNNEDQTVFYVFNFSTGGYMIISAEDQVTPVLSYSFNGHFIKNDPNLPPEYQYFLNNYKEQISIVKTRQLMAKKSISEKWGNYSSNKFKNTRNIENVNPLLNIEGIAWDQGCYYNADCPAASGGDCGHTYVGCVATAMAQIMRFYHWPDQGIGSHTYSDPTYGTQTANFGTSTYNWSAMPASVTSTNAEVAKVSYHCGVAVEMNYSTSGSGAVVYGYVREALVNNFNYSTDAMYAYRGNYTDANWKALMYSDLDAGYPIFYSGTDQNGGSGHAFVCDGYQANDNFHFNWGWSGYYNSYNTIDNLIPGGTGTGGGTGDFSYNQDAVFRIHPSSGGSALLGSWIQQVSGFTTASRGITNISIVDANTVWALAYDGSTSAANVQEFTKTTNGGTTWTPGTINVGNTSLGISMINAISSTTAWVAVYPTSAGQYGGIWKTTNGGSTWSKQTSATYNNASSFTNVVYFWNANTGFCMGDPINGDFEIYTTTNGGTTWTQVSGANIPDPLSGEYGYTGQYEVVGNNIWFTTNKGRLFHSSDNGHNFTVAQTPLSDFGGSTQSGNFSFKDANNGMIIDNNATVYKTTDGGNNWSQATISGTIFTSGLCWVEGTNTIFSTGAASGASGSSYSEDGGSTWTTIDGEQHLCVDFINQNTGWSGWFNTDATTGGMWKWSSTTTDIPAVNHIDNQLSVYPNPTNGNLTIDLPTSSNSVEINVVNLLGKQVYHKIINNATVTSQTTLNLKNLSNGIYILTVNTDGNISQTKVVKQ